MFETLIGRKPNYLDHERYRKYAVIAPFLPDTEEFLFQIRSPRLNRQPGEICFPGGQIEAGERPVDAGIRETAEELLVEKESIQMIAPLDIFTSPYHVIIYPFLAKLSGYNGTFYSNEVQEIFTVPFEFFLTHEPEVYYNEVTVNPASDFPYHLLGSETYPWGKSVYPILFYQYNDKVIWEITARFVHNIVTLYKNA